MRSAIFDIECSALEGVGAGLMLCACVRPYSTQRTRTFRLKYNKDWNSQEAGFLEVEERDLLAELIEELEKYDLLIGHNIINFDLPYIRSRAMAHEMRYDQRPFVYDTMKAWGRVKARTVLNGYGKPSKSLDMIADFLGVDQEKTKIYPRQHWMTIWGNDLQREEAMQNLVNHCQRDVRMNAEVYRLIMPLDEKGAIRRWM